MINHVKVFFLTVILAISIMGLTAAYARAETYRAGKFTVTLGDGENGKTYKGCDAQGQCIHLDSGTSWRDGGYRGITWEHGTYTYSISWREGSSNQMYLNVYNGKNRILHQLMIFVVN